MALTLEPKRKSYHRESTCEIRKLLHSPSKVMANVKSFFPDKLADRQTDGQDKDDNPAPDLLMPSIRN